ncbi:exosortase family protein XrtF [Flavobacterium sp.]|uniref:exosortase family protein XrtF n=1 Tax=Flavobacterium sp. TaxID=239 RepID=UPI003265018C
MKKYLLQYRPFLLFITTFFIIYIVAAVIYKLYLDSFDEKSIDGITNIVGHQVFKIMNFFNCDIRILKSESNPYLEVWYNQKYVIRIVEGCNAVSVIVLFGSFVIAFSGKFKTTLIFILFGILFIHILNISRIALLTVLMFHFPEKEHLLHGVFFPLVIYGFIFILWIVWVNKFSKYAR